MRDPRRVSDQATLDEEHLAAAAEWLCTAQDVTGDGGISGRYHLDKGWSSSYPETTGYIIPTFLMLSDALDDHGFQQRARLCCDFLLSVQLPHGGFPAGEVRENRSKPSVFNSAQIIGGLQAWAQFSGDERAIKAARRCAEWLISVQDEDGAWRKHLYLDSVTTYTAHASCWLAVLGEYLGESSYKEAAARHLAWVLSKYDSTAGWFDLAGFSDRDHVDRVALTHTIGYTLWGVLVTSHLVGCQEGISAVRSAARGIANCLDKLNWIPGVLDHEWRGRANYACLTGNAQLALIWLKLYELEKESRWLSAAVRALDLVKAMQPLVSSDPGIRGGVPGSAPIWGKYLYNSFPNWAVKFFIDGLLEKQRVSTATGFQ